MTTIVTRQNGSLRTSEAAPDLAAQNFPIATSISKSWKLSNLKVVFEPLSSTMIIAGMIIENKNPKCEECNENECIGAYGFDDPLKLQSGFSQYSFSAVLSTTTYCGG